MKQTSEKQQIHSCPICGSSDFELFLETRDFFLTGEKFSLDKCRNCHFVFTNPVPVEKHLNKYYESPNYLSHKVNKINLKGFLYDTVRNRNIRKKYDLVTAFHKQGRILDIGQGTGELLHYFSGKNWTTVGIEPNDQARQYSEKKYGLPVYPEEELDRLEKHSFDVITLWHVLEHVPDLNGRMEQIRRLLKPGGTLFIAVPNLESPDFLSYREYWAALDVPRHLYHFTSKSIRDLLEKHHFFMSDQYPMKFDAFYVCLLSEQYKGNGFPYFKAALNGLHSNRIARGNGNFSSMIFVAKQK